MADLNSVAELAWKAIFPEGSDETKVKKEQFIADAKLFYANEVWLKIMATKREDGEIEVPSYLLSEKEIDVVNNVMDLSELKILRSLPFEIWLQNLGGLNCECRYVKTTFNLAQVLCDDDSLSDSDKTYYPLGKKIKFPKGVHKTPLSITYANGGENVNGAIEIDDQIAASIRIALTALYLGKVGKEDKTNNSNNEQ